MDTMIMARRPERPRQDADDARYSLGVRTREGVWVHSDLRESLQDTRNAAAMARADGVRAAGVYEMGHDGRELLVEFEAFDVPGLDDRRRGRD